MKIKKQADNHAARICARRIFSKYREVFENADFITPVPSHWTRLLKRGFNPANIIAAELSKISDVKYSNFLKRNRKTDYQKNKTTIERLTNVKEAFVCATNLEGKSVIVADDVLTTGATLNECAKTLKTAGAKYVACVTIASASAKTG
jgi:ComF family protein